MTIQYASQNLIKSLQTIYTVSEASNIAAWVIESLTGYRPHLQKSNAGQELTTEQQQQLHHYTKELLTHRPVQYVLGECYFMDMKLFVNESVLVPRPETEELADWAIKYSRLQGGSSMAVLDIGTGSGCIALALKKHLAGAAVTAVDISAAALGVAGRNAAGQGLAINWQQHNILDPETWASFPGFDIIISNPPYITLPEKESMEQHVLGYEPHQALFVSNNDPQQFYKAIEAFAARHLNPQGAVFLELHRDFAQDTRAYYETKGWHTVLKKDMQENDRMLLATRPI